LSAVPHLRVGTCQTHGQEETIQQHTKTHLREKLDYFYSKELLIKIDLRLDDIQQAKVPP
jgi:hypothetical protein